MNYGMITPDLDEDLDDVPLDEGIDYDTPSPEPANLEFFRSYSEISTRSLCSAMGSYMAIREKSEYWLVVCHIFHNFEDRPLKINAFIY